MYGQNITANENRKLEAEKIMDKAQEIINGEDLLEEILETRLMPKQLWRIEKYL